MSAPGESAEGGEGDDGVPSPFPTTMGAVAPRALALAGYSDLRQLTTVSPRELLAIHGVGPKAIRILREALAANGLAFRGE